MKTVVRWVVPPRLKNIGIINAGIDVFCRSQRFSQEDSLRLQACVEGVFGYCVGNICSQGQRDEIIIRLQHQGVEVSLVMQHSGPGGEWDGQLKEGAGLHIRRTSFDSMGLFIAIEMLQSLACDNYFDIATGQNVRTYTLKYRPSAGA